MALVRRLKGLLGRRADEEHGARVAELTLVVRDLEERHERRLHRLCVAADRLAAELAATRQELAAARAELEASRVQHADLRDRYAALTEARDRLARQYRGLAAQQQPRRASVPPTAAALGSEEAYDAFADFVEFCKHVGVRPPHALPDYMA